MFRGAYTYWHPVYKFHPYLDTLSSPIPVPRVVCDPQEWRLYKRKRHAPLEMFHLAQRLLDQVDTFLEAPIPNWTEYNRDQVRVFGNEKEMEKFFQNQVNPTDQRPFGETIPENYLAYFETELNAFADWIHRHHGSGSKQGSYNMKTHVVVCWFVYEPDTIRLDIIRVRPCAQGLRILKVILFWISQNCNRNQSLSVCMPLSRTAPELLKISENFQQRRKTWILEQPTAATFKVDAQVRVTANNRIELIQEEWPSARDLNDQETVNKRFERVQPKAELAKLPYTSTDGYVLPETESDDYISHFNELMGIEDTSNREDEPWFGNCGTADEIERFEIHIHPDSKRKSNGVVVMYRDKQDALFMHFEGRRYQLHNFHGAFRPKLLNEPWTLLQGGDTLVFISTTDPNSTRFSMKASANVLYFENANAQTPLGKFYPDVNLGSFEASDGITTSYTLIDIERQGRCFTHSKITYQAAAKLILKLTSVPLENPIELKPEATQHIEFSIGPQKYILKHDLKGYKTVSNSPIEYLGQFHQFRHLKALLLSALQPIKAEQKHPIHNIFQDAVPLEGILNLEVGTRAADLWPLDDRIVLSSFSQTNFDGMDESDFRVTMYWNQKAKKVYLHGPNFKSMTTDVIDCTVMDIAMGYWSLDDDSNLWCQMNGRRKRGWKTKAVTDKFEFETHESLITEMHPHIELTLDHTQFKVQLYDNTLRCLERPMKFWYAKMVIEYNCEEGDITHEKDASITLKSARRAFKTTRYLNIRPDLKFRTHKGNAPPNNTDWKENGQLYTVHDLSFCLKKFLNINVEYNREMKSYNEEYLKSSLESYSTPDNRNDPAAIPAYAIQPNEPSRILRTMPDTEIDTFPLKVSAKSNSQFKSVSAKLYTFSGNMCLQMNDRHYKSVHRVHVTLERLKQGHWDIQFIPPVKLHEDWSIDADDRTYYLFVYTNDDDEDGIALTGRDRGSERAQFLVQSQDDLFR